MPLFVLDTDIFSHFQHGQQRVCNEVLRHAANELAVTVITVEESLSGWYSLVRRSKSPDKVVSAYERLADTVRALADFQIMPFSLAAIGRFDMLRQARLGVKGNDLRIAAIVLEQGATLVTRNLVDFQRIPGLHCVNWFD